MQIDLRMQNALWRFHFCHWYLWLCPEETYFLWTDWIHAVGEVQVELVSSYGFMNEKSCLFSPWNLACWRTLKKRISSGTFVHDLKATTLHPFFNFAITSWCGIRLQSQKPYLFEQPSPKIEPFRCLGLHLLDWGCRLWSCSSTRSFAMEKDLCMADYREHGRESVMYLLL